MEIVIVQKLLLMNLSYEESIRDDTNPRLRPLDK